MAWTEKYIGNGREQEPIGDNDFLKGSQPSLSARGSPVGIAAARKGFEGKDAFSYANILRSRNKFVDALAIYESFLEKDSGNVEAHIGKCICLQMQNMGTLAFDSFAEAVRLDPQNACALMHCSMLYKDEGQLVEAAEEGIQKYYEALKIDPHNAPAYYNLGVVYSEMMQYDAALNYFEKAAFERPMCLAVSPNFEIAKNNMAIALTYLGTKAILEEDINQGIAYYKKALYYNWHYADAMYNLGVAYGEMMKFDMAIVFYELAFHFNTHGAEAWNNLGVIYKDQDNLDKAVECHQIIHDTTSKALSIKPNFSQPLNNLGVGHMVQGKMDAAASINAGNITMAVNAYKRRLEIDPDSRNAGQLLLNNSSTFIWIVLYLSRTM
ncbi:probable UDP-N-acetylglucosamine--peptide N-acetylglucosaminyltransferase SPINDLY [Hevea brasiliensis]|uniref:probable UDP-N-acetylglucosamine--peptide N-acetylglucosaminyltransferase SPINDLY n=1 Tax=Hevea brasiliensis TaxID=3981 RepID=UPI0025DF32BC|nr:probable UDP-N-acetylglucosamine--peptide N-acetylglucosaminyltransferase SPINDLY [Hevea brasiliensis]